MKKIIRVVGCVMQHGDKILLLLRSAKETDPSLWGIPAGKVERGETDLETVVREVFEETGIRLEETELNNIGHLPIEYDTFVVDFPMFHMVFKEQPEVKLTPREHIDLQWISPKDALELPNLMKDVDVIINKFCIEKLDIK
jgi:8-oxo-dGTP pyrophosphatase MutT (NUDIX family)